MPVVLRVKAPDLDEVREAALLLHRQRAVWQGELFGWQAEYNPPRAERALDSKMSFTPADFCIGESGIWFFSLLWEHGDDALPVEFLDESAIVGNLTLGNM